MYFIYHKDWVPEAVAARHKYPAIYGDWRLFVSGIERETGIPPTNVMDVAGLALTGEDLLNLFAVISHPNYVVTR
jgi:hypothetical protein